MYTEINIIENYRERIFQVGTFLLFIEIFDRDSTVYITRLYYIIIISLFHTSHQLMLATW